MAASSDMELMKMIRAFRVTDLQTLLVYAGRNKVGKKNELQNRAIDLLKLRSQSIEMKIREIHTNRFQQSRGHSEIQDLHPLGAINEPSGSNYGMRPSLQPMYAMPSRSTMSGRAPMSGRNPMVRPDPVSEILQSHKVINQNMRPAMNMYNPYPVNPDVKFKELPFYDILYELFKPTSLVVLPNERFREREFSFYLSPQQVSDLQRIPDAQVQMRMCLLDTSTEQDDDIPPSICVKVNNRVINLPNPIPTSRPGVEPKRPRRPIDITVATKRTATEANLIHISWATTSSKPHVIAIYLVQRLSSSILINRLKGNGVRNPDHTTAVIKEKLCQDRDSEIATMSLRGSLICPLGKIKMKLPCRALTCSHVQCFDATLYVQMNEKKPKWICPVCDKPAVFKSLAIDGLFLDIISKAPAECCEVQFHEDGSWTPLIPVVKKPPPVSETVLDVRPKVIPSKPKKSVEVISLDSDSDTEESWPPPQRKVLVQSDRDSPILVESPVRKSDPYDIFAPGSSKSSDMPPPQLNLRKSDPETLDLESEVDCVNAPRLSIFPSPSNYQSIPTPPQSSNSAIHENKIVNDDYASDFDFYAIIQNHDESRDSAENDEPEIIDIDDDDDDDQD